MWLRRVPAIALVAGLTAGVSVGTAAAAPVDGVVPSYLLVGGTGSSNIGVLREVQGRLTRVGPMVPIDAFTLSIAVTPNQRFAYVAHTVSGTLQGFRVNDDGTLARLADARLDPGAPIVGAVVSPDGKWLFATVGSMTNEVRTFAIGPSGGLSPVDSAAIAGATSGLSIPVVSPDGRYLFAPSFIGATMDSFAIGPDGRLTPAGPQVRTGDRPALPSVTPDGRFLYITNEGTNDVSGYRIEPGGALTPIGRFPTKMVPHGMAITPDSRYLYLPQTGGAAVNGFEIRDDGALIPLPGADEPSAPGHFPGRVVLSPDAERLYAIDTLAVTGTAQVFTYRVRPDGSLDPGGEPPVDAGVMFSDGATGVFATPGA
ncbi:6-phosphogluconolactonase (cycloisomerase 2 family) [Nocardia mexicana]|uniref:6-phosphogluconolactonase (Cycloisomerase 2 family) n=2 Tax=Nocardia mexicana TaxID=279262 RepID=A0A370HKD6_9NOCA|nr:6-phosphogluconolactonase (cycloisomerase 2 family) [Nocardia mexicana]